MTDNFKMWLDNATGDEVDALAERAGVSTAYIRHIALDRRKAKAELAARIEKGTKKLEREGLPPVTRGDLNEACNNCPYFKSCKKT